MKHWCLSPDELWDKKTTPYDSKVWQDLDQPWQLLAVKVMDRLLESYSDQSGLQRIDFRGLTLKDSLICKGQWFEGEIKVDQPDKSSKGLMRCFLDGEELKGASYIQAGVYFSGEQAISIGEGVRIQPGAYVQGPTALGDYTEVRQGAFVRGRVLSGRSSVLGHASEFKNVILHDQAKAAHFAYVGDSILGSQANLGAGTKISNLKITQDEIIIRSSAASFPTGMHKLGALIGDQVETGCNSVLNPGVVLARGCMVYPAISVRCGIYKAKSWIKGKIK